MLQRKTASAALLSVDVLASLVPAGEDFPGHTRYAVRVRKDTGAIGSTANPKERQREGERTDTEIAALFSISPCLHLLRFTNFLAKTVKPCYSLRVFACIRPYSSSAFRPPFFLRHSYWFGSRAF